MDDARHTDGRRGRINLACWITGLTFPAGIVVVMILESGSIGATAYGSSNAAIAVGISAVMTLLVAFSCAVDVFMPIGRGNLELLIAGWHRLRVVLLRDEAWWLNVVVACACMALLQIVTEAFH